MKAVFFRVLEAEDKAAVLGKAIRVEEGADARTRFEVNPNHFEEVPRAPFAYWMGNSVRALFRTCRLLEAPQLGRAARRGLGTNDDFRFLRLWYETRHSERDAWINLAKGGHYSPFYASLTLAVNWWSKGAELRAFFIGRGESPSRNIRSESEYRRPGLTWPLRTSSGLSVRVLPAGCIFGHKGPVVLVDGDDHVELLSLLALVNSRPFSALVELQLAAADAAARSYEVGVLQRTPVPSYDPTTREQLATLARLSWSLTRRLDTRTETSHAFHLPALLQVAGISLRERATSWLARVSENEAELQQVQHDIDDRCFGLYGIDAENRRRIEEGFGAAPPSSADEDEEEVEAEEEDERGEVEAAPLVASLVSWAAGTAFGRFEVRLATGEREPPPEPDPFDPLPVCSPGMLTGEDGLPATAAPSGYLLDLPPAGILVDDPGHTDDLAVRIRRVFEVAFSSDADAILHEAAEILDAPGHDLRPWLARSFFAEHVKRYSKSRRKAPIYWQLATPSASYSVWLYIHRFTRDTLHRVLHDYVTPKLQHEQRKLDALRTEAGDNPTAAQRSEIAAQEAFVEELQTFREEVARVAPLWNPDLDDGVIVNFALLWRLVPRHRAWQRECKSCWDKLAAGDYEWAHLAMHLWPERVVPKCAEDRSLAIAHGLEDFFWHEDEKGKWHRRQVGEDEIRTLVEERTSPAVKAALQDLQSAATPAGGAGASRRRRRSASARPERGAT